MANQEHLDILMQGVEIWNKWREENEDVEPDLSGANLSEIEFDGNINFIKTNLQKTDLHGLHLGSGYFREANLKEANLQSANLVNAYLKGANLEGANLNDTILVEASLEGANLNDASLEKANLLSSYLVEASLKKSNLTEATLVRAYLDGANLSGASLIRADLEEATCNASNFSGAILDDASFKGADLTDALLMGASLLNTDLRSATLVNTDFTNATLRDCNIYGISSWNVNLDEAIQDNFIITDEGEAIATVDDLEVAQFIYLMSNNKKIRNVLETLTTKSVLILGRFANEALKYRLDSIRNKLRELDYLPIVFDFERLTGQDYTETVKLLAGMSKFVIADLSQARSIQQELQAIVPDFEIPVVPIIEKRDITIDGNTFEDSPWSMFESHDRANHVLQLMQFDDTEQLMNKFKGIIVNRAETKYQELVIKKAEGKITMISADEIPDDE